MSVLTFKGGVHPKDGKILSKTKAIQELLPTGEIVIPLSQHIGAPANPIVAVGDRVLVGQKIGEASGFISANIHSSVSGTVKKIEPRLVTKGTNVMSVVIENDNLYEEQAWDLKDYLEMTKEEKLEAIKEAGIVGMGGAGFPTNVKLSPKNPDEINYIIVNGAIAALIYTGAVQVQVGNLTQGEVVAIINYMSQILVELVKLANLIVTITKALACADRVAGVLAIENEPVAIAENVTGQIEGSEAGETVASGAVAPEAAYIEFDHVSLKYQGAGEETLRNLSFSVQKGQTVGVIGGTGSGKTSLVNLIPGFYPVTSGAIRIQGRDIKELSEDALRNRIGMVPQKAVLFKGTIRSNLQWGNPEATEEEMWDAIDMAQAREVVEGKAGKLDAEVAQNGKNFSGGQKQRLTIARALVRKPEILILDDSASALDYATDAKLRQAIRQIDQETTTFIVSQRASSIRHADLILVLDDGEIVGRGTHEELLTDCEVYQEIYYSQYPDEKNKLNRNEVLGREDV